MWWTKKKPQPTTEEKLLEAKGRLARIRKLPESDFTRYHQYVPNFVLKHGIDEKPKAIARIEGEIAELEVLVNSEKEARP